MCPLLPNANIGTPITAFKDIQSNPANMMKYQNNPKVQKVMEKLSSKLGGGGGGGMGGAGGFF